MPIVTINHYDRTPQIINGDFKVPSAISIERPTFPFEGNTTDYLIEQDFVVFTDYYLETMPDVGSANDKPEYSDFFFSHDSPLSNLGNGVSQFTRTWAKLPGLGTESGSFRQEFESFVWTRPGIDNSHAVIIYFIDPATSTFNGDKTELTMKTLGHFTHSLDSQYQYASVYYQFITVLPTGAGTNQVDYLFPQTTYESPIINRGNDYITVKTLNLSGSLTWYQGFSKPNVQINERQVNVSSILQFSYWLPGHNVEDPSTIPVGNVFEILDENGNSTTKLSELTTPTLKQYNDMVASGSLIQVEESIIRRWQGNIFEKQERFIRAI